MLDCLYYFCIFTGLQNHQLVPWHPPKVTSEGSVLKFHYEVTDYNTFQATADIVLIDTQTISSLTRESLFGLVPEPF